MKLIVEFFLVAILLASCGTEEGPTCQTAPRVEAETYLALR